jgi:hypothetical protein
LVLFYANIARSASSTQNKSTSTHVSTLIGFSVQLTNDEVEGRAQQWDMEQLRED